MDDRVMYAGIFVVALMCLFPPHKVQHHNSYAAAADAVVAERFGGAATYTGETAIKYRAVFASPNWTENGGNDIYKNARVDMGRLIAQIGVVIALTLAVGTLMRIAKTSSRTPSQSEE